MIMFDGLRKLTNELKGVDPLSSDFNKKVSELKKQQDQPEKIDYQKKAKSDHKVKIRLSDQAEEKLNGPKLDKDTKVELDGDDKPVAAYAAKAMQALLNTNTPQEDALNTERSQMILADTLDLTNLVKNTSVQDDDALYLTADLDQDLCLGRNLSGKTLNKAIKTGIKTLHQFDQKAEKAGIKMPDREIDRILKHQNEQKLKKQNLTHDAQITDFDNELDVDL